MNDVGGAGRDLRCKRCRAVLARDVLLLEQHEGKGGGKRSEGGCSHHWLSQPIGWMRAEMEEGKLEGRLSCPNARCKVMVGRYAWQGLRCSCGEWVIPGISLAKGKVDEVAAKRVVKVEEGEEKGVDVAVGAPPNHSM